MEKRIIQTLHNFQSLANENIIETGKDNIYKISINRSTNDNMVYLGVTLIDKQTNCLEYHSYKVTIFINKKERLNSLKIYCQLGDLKKEFINVIKKYVSKIEYLVKMDIDYIEFILIY